MKRWVLAVGLLLALAGYFGSWIAHPVAGLAITGLDFGEYVKFLPEVRAGSLWVWRAGFYMPLVAVSAAALLAAYRSNFAFPWWMRGALLALAIVAALNLLPPAWTPGRLLEAEFRLQTSCLVLLLAGVAVSPFLALMPGWLAASMVTLLCVVGMVAPVQGFIEVLPGIEALYGHGLGAAWGLWLMNLGLVIVVIAYWRQLKTIES